MATPKMWILVTNPEKQVTLTAHAVTIEPSGALSFWAVTQDNMESVLLYAYAPGTWDTLVFKGLALPATDSAKEDGK